jgi:hypothetical protein
MKGAIRVLLVGHLSFGATTGVLLAVARRLRLL